MVGKAGGTAKPLKQKKKPQVELTEEEIAFKKRQTEDAKALKEAAAAASGSKKGKKK
jgi:Translation machinery associated TMA7